MKMNVFMFVYAVLALQGQFLILENVHDGVSACRWLGQDNKQLRDASTKESITKIHQVLNKIGKEYGIRLYSPYRWR